MNSDLVGESADAMAPESPQPLPLTANSSRCTSPLSPPSDPNASASSVDEESVTTLNLSLPSKSLNNSAYLLKNNSIKQSSPSVSNHINHSDPNGSYRSSHKFKSDSSIVPSRGRSKHINQMPFASEYASIPNPQSPDFVQLLLEYRQVLLDVLAKSILFGDKESCDPNSKSVTLPLKCTCGFTSKLSNQITRSSTYVHQLELRFRSLMETSRANESKYTPKRPWFINPTPFSPSYVFPSKSSLLDKKPMLSRQSTGKQVSLFRSGTSSINSSLNGDDDDVDSDEDDVNDNLTGNLNTNNFNNGSLEEMNGGGKTILEGYLESMKNIPSDDGSDDDDKDDADDEDLDGTGEDDSLRGPGKRIDIKTKKLVLQLQRNGSSFTNISRQIGISRKSVRRIISNYRTYGMLEKKRESRIQKGMRDLILKLYSQGRSYTQISRATTVSKPTISKIVKQYVDSNVFAKGPNGLVVQNGGGPISIQDMYADGMDDDMDEEKEMIVDEDAVEDDDEQDLEDEEDNINDDLPIKSEMEASIVSTPYPLALTKPHIKHRKNMSLIHGSFNGYPQTQHSPQQAHFNNGNLMNNHLSLIHQSERFKPYDTKMRQNASAELNASHHRISKSNQIVPQPAASKLYSLQRQQQNAIRLSNNGNSSRNDNHHRLKSSKLNRHDRNEMSIKESIIVPEADKNNNTTLANCNVTITNASNHTNGGNSSNGQHSPTDSNSLLPPIPASLADSNSDSEANLVPKPFGDGFPAGIMNSLNPNRATKLTLEDFNVVWQLRSQHWTHNQIRKYFEQRGKSISKSSISRIMNGKQRNFQQFFNVIPSSL